MPEPKARLADFGRLSPDDGYGSLRLSRYVAGGLSAIWVLAVVLYLTFGTAKAGEGTKSCETAERRHLKTSHVLWRVSILDVRPDQRQPTVVT